MKKENDLLEETLSIAEDGYAAAYRFLRTEYEKDPESCGPQTLYFLACLAGGDGRPAQALDWLTTAILEKGWWYRPEVLEDDDLAALRDNPSFLELQSISGHRYAGAVSGAKAVCTWARKEADNLFLAVHGNTQNGPTARADWAPGLDPAQWQLETVQSAEPDGSGTFRWRYDMASYQPVADALARVQEADYRRIACGGFSAGCDMLLRAVLFAPARCDLLLLQSPWIPVLEDHAEALADALRQKNVELKIFCGAQDEDCLPMAKQLYEIADKAGVPASLAVQEGSRHQFPGELSALREALRACG